MGAEVRAAFLDASGTAVRGKKLYDSESLQAGTGLLGS